MQFSKTTITVLAFVCGVCAATDAAQAQPGTVLSHQKISDTEGGFTGDLDFPDQFGISVTSLGDLDGDGVSDLAVGATGDDGDLGNIGKRSNIMRQSRVTAASFAAVLSPLAGIVAASGAWGSAFGQGHEFENSESPSQLEFSPVQVSAEDEAIAAGGGYECRSCTVQDITLMFCSPTEHCCGTTVEIPIEVSGTLDEPTTLIVELWENDIWFDDLICDHVLDLEAGSFNIQLSCTIDLCIFRFGNIELFAELTIPDCCSCSTTPDIVVFDFDGICGDGIPAPVCEECDDGGESATCDADCTVAECGDGTLNVTAGEECDGMDDTACPGACLSDCTCGPFCGNGVCDPGEHSCNCPDDCEGECPLPASVDIKPGSCPNPFNRHGHGVLPVALVGTGEFDATEVDLSTLQLSRADGVGGSVAPNEGPPGPHSMVKDAARPFDGEPCDCQHHGPDGIDDLAMKFRTDELVEALELDNLPGGSVVELMLSGNLLDGTPFVADDCIVILPPGETSPANAHVESTLVDTFVEVEPLDLNFDDDGFADFSRSYYGGTVMTLTAPLHSAGRRFVRWLVDTVPQPIGMRSIEVVVSEDTTLKAVYARPTHPNPDRRTEPDGPLE